MTAGLEHARALDAEDALAPFRERFVIRDPELIYLDGNSLGRLPRASAALARRLIAEGWGERLIRGWNEGWLAAPERLGAKIARLIGAEPDEVIVADATTVNLFKLALAALRAQAGRYRILTDDLNFPSDLHALQGACDLLGRGHRLERVRSADGVHGPEAAIMAALDEDTALLSLSHATFRSGFVYDMAALTQAAQAVGALTLWDLSHSAGALEIDLGAAGADLAVGCSYKYLSGGPGAPAFLYVRRELQERLQNPIPGWLGSATPFDFAPQHRPATGVRRFLTGTPPLLSLALVEPGVELLLEAGMARVREKSLRQTGYLLELWEAELEPLGFALASPRDPDRRGSHVALRHPQGLGVDLALIREARVIPDFRPPDVIRLGVAPLYTRFAELHEAVRRLAEVVRRGRHLAYQREAPAVT